MTHARRELGIAGEAAVAQWYRQRGWTVVAANWRCRNGEIDLVLRRGSTVVFCEVKTRSSTAFGSPFDAVGLQKQRRLRRLAGEFLGAHRLGAATIRFDVAGVLGGTVEVVEDAF